jgi:hypothetical protein
MAGVPFKIMEGIVYARFGWTGLGRQKTLTSFLSDENGEFNLVNKYRRQKNTEYWLLIGKQEWWPVDSVSDILEDYYVKDPYEGVYYIKEDDSDYAEFQVLPISRLKVIARDVPPIIPGTTMGATAKDESGFYGDDVCSSSEPSVYHRVPNNGKIYISWTVNSNQGGGIYYDTITVAPFTKNVYYIDY